MASTCEIHAPRANTWQSLTCLRTSRPEEGSGRGHHSWLREEGKGSITGWVRQVIKAIDTGHGGKLYKNTLRQGCKAIKTPI